MSGRARVICFRWTPSSFPRFSRPGHAVTGDRSRTGAEKRQRVGKQFAHSIIDDHSRLAFTELHDDEQAPTVTAFVERALAFFAAHDIRAQALADRQRLELHPQPCPRRAARRARHRASPDPAAHPEAQREGRALPADAQAANGDFGQVYRNSDARQARSRRLANALQHHPQPQLPSKTGRRSPVFGSSRGTTPSGSGAAARARGLRAPRRALRAVRPEAPRGSRRRVRRRRGRRR